MQPDRIFLNDTLFVLHAASKLDWPDLTRTNFQKILYFCSILCPLEKLQWGYYFVNAAYGPFNRQLHQATDTLVSHRFASIEDLIIQKDSKIRARYKITDTGRQEVAKITRLNKERARSEWIYRIMKVLDIYGQTVITKLAYKEPTFYKMRLHNRGGVIGTSPDENESIALLEQLDIELQKRYSIKLDTTASKLITFFNYLSADIGREK